MVDEVLQKLISTIEALSPLLWSTLVKQAIIWGAGFVFLTWSIRVAVKKYEDEWDEGFVVFSRIASYVTGGIALAWFIGGMLRLLNPQYYAILEIVYQLK
jgi:hypothetical protein